jgi:hypothetical protein
MRRTDFRARIARGAARDQHTCRTDQSRSGTAARQPAETNARFNKLEVEIGDIKKEIRGFKLNTIAEIYKANLTVASFVDHEQRIQALERKSS